MLFNATAASEAVYTADDSLTLILFVYCCFVLDVLPLVAMKTGSVGAAFDCTNANNNRRKLGVNNILSTYTDYE
jgi:hypothetical protein